jgi:arginine decarboxylase-like protein
MKQTATSVTEALPETCCVIAYQLLWFRHRFALRFLHLQAPQASSATVNCSVIQNLFTFWCGLRVVLPITTLNRITVLNESA